MKRITRKRRLTPEEAAKYKAIREQVAEELPDLIARHHERMASLDQLEKLFTQLKAAREAKGLSLADLTELTGMDRSALDLATFSKTFSEIFSERFPASREQGRQKATTCGTISISRSWKQPQA